MSSSCSWRRVRARRRSPGRRCSPACASAPALPSRVSASACCSRAGRPSDLFLEDRHRARPAGRGAADLVREAGDGEAVARQRLEIVQLLKMAVADVTTGLVAFPDDRGIVVLGPLLGGPVEWRVPAPGVGAGEPDALLEQ